MAQKSYRITTKPLHYYGKTAAVGAVVSDIPGISIPWLREYGHIVPFDMPIIVNSDPDPTPAETPVADGVTEMPSA